MVDILSTDVSSPKNDEADTRVFVKLANHRSLATGSYNNRLECKANFTVHIYPHKRTGIHIS